MNETLVTVALVILVLLFVVNRIVAASQRVQGHDRCAHCRSRLRFLGVGKAGDTAGYATTCAKCGREQPWA